METQEKLTLKELVGYLPWDLKVQNKNRNIKIITINGFYYSNSELMLNSKELNGGISCDEIKLILHPMSDIDKEIYGLTKSIPLNNLRFIYPNIQNFNSLFSENNKDFWFTGKIDLTRSISEYCVINKLFEWHFDVFGLINKGLAVDINTL